MIKLWSKLKLKRRLFLTTSILITFLTAVITTMVFLILPNIYYSTCGYKPINKVKFFDILPMVIVLVVIFSIIASFLFMSLITKPLVDIIDKEHLQMVRKKEFMAAISHDLKTPITIISGQLEGMIYNVGKYKDRDFYLNKCYEDMQELKFLINRTIEISKRDLLTDGLVKTELDINALLEEVVSKHKFLYNSKNISMNLNIYNTKKVFANKEDMQTVLNNLISNAIIYSPENEDIIINLFEINKRVSETLVRFSIENTGISLNKEKLAKIFDPLYRVESSRNKNTGGTGLGLYFVDQILKNHEFFYKMFSRENSTIFIVDFKTL